MSDMQWRRADGSTGEYTGPLMHLGHGIPRNMRDHGIRRAIFDLAFGYVSGFPVRDIIPFSVRSLFPQKTIPTIEGVDAEPEPTHLTVYVECPECGAPMPATIAVSVENNEGAHAGEATLLCKPDMTDIHAHMWTHGEAA